ncbi:hypothetical protein Desca_0649 [Desulfotomaculum nigrificans CO-1-SRB]|uniref:Uncharacterized protein n=1 Tax=Desulfotomaculum nigrificans (strain DSM 14880 / VKM B-2319 / CO-1-SRB) TaxID=868595 RepID=F6B891_DESCC|nr:hypothetical protein [Desulfotomaculum nigrificans]AEF93536.1 hypothetical protein Desca_0649 [Desulfotomaculum nigrificans CO-1-SRB]
MNKCKKCKKVFEEEPFYSITDYNTYCSMDCLPDEALEHPYSFEYFQLVDIVRDIEDSVKNLSNYYERDELLDDIDLAIVQHTDIYLNEGEGTFYGTHAMALIKKLMDIFETTREWQLDIKKPAIKISWYELPDQVVKDILEELRIFECDFNINSGYFDTAITQIIFFEDEGTRNICYESVLGVAKKFMQDYDNDPADYISLITAKYCEGCLWYEDETEFEYHDEVNLYVCQSCINKSAAEFRGEI